VPSQLDVERLSPAISQKRSSRGRCHHAKNPVYFTAGGARRSRLAHTDKGVRIARARMQICKPNSPKSCEICHLCFLNS
jgi:hypothetical protein